MGGQPDRARLLAVTPFVCVLAVQGPGGEMQRVHATEFGSPPTQRAAELDGPATPTDYGDCGPGAIREPGLQGQVPLAEQLSGASAAGYRCNLELIGQEKVGLRGQNFQLAWYRDCAYVSTVGIQAVTGALGEPDPSLDGIAALDVSDPTAPKLTDIVESPVSKSSHEAIEVNQRRGLLVTTQGGLIAQYIEVYDVSKDCRHPTFLGRYDAGIPIFHGMKVSDDGKTVYATDTFGFTGVGQIMHVVDISDPTNPTRLMRWDPLMEADHKQYASHDLDISPDGNRLYLGTAAYQAVVGVVVGGGPTVGETPSLSIADVSEVQARAPEPRHQGALDDVAAEHRPHRAADADRRQAVPARQRRGAGERRPVPLGLGPHHRRFGRAQPEARLRPAARGQPGPQLRRDAARQGRHLLDPLRRRRLRARTRYVFYTYYTGGMRVFDVRDPAKPKEVAYFHSPATPNTKFPSLTPFTPDANPQVTDLTTSMVRFRPETGEIWVVSVNSGFQVLRFTAGSRSSGQRSRCRRFAPGRPAARARPGRRPLPAGLPWGGRRLKGGGDAGPTRAVQLPVRGRRVVEVPIGAPTRAALERQTARRCARSPRSTTGSAASASSRCVRALGR